jgi:hypothetical protein
MRMSLIPAPGVSSVAPSSLGVNGEGGPLNKPSIVSMQHSPTVLSWAPCEECGH